MPQKFLRLNSKKTYGLQQIWEKIRPHTGWKFIPLLLNSVRTWKGDAK